MNKFELQAFNKQYRRVAKKMVTVSEAGNLQDLISEAKDFGLWVSTNLEPVNHVDIAPKYGDTNNILPEDVTEISIRRGE